MESITLDLFQIIVVATLSYFFGWLLIRITGGGYVTKNEFKTYVNQNEIDKGMFKDKLTQVQQRFCQEDRMSNRRNENSESIGIIDSIIESIVARGVNALIRSINKKT